MISGGPMGKYANISYWNRVISDDEIMRVKSNISYIPADAEHQYDMKIEDGVIIDIGNKGGWDFTTVRSFVNGVYEV
jgi:hypothetical protein